MSRCFPFLPPGYERKHQSEDLDILREEKRKEKRHKKEKRDKGNREGKEKREKDRSEGKYKEKRSRKEKHKDKKDKHRNKKDEEDQGKDKEKSSISEESTVAGKIEGKIEKRLRPTVHNGAKGTLLDEVKNATRFQVQNGDEVKHATQFQVQNGGKPIQNNLVFMELKESKFALGPNSRIRNHEKELVSQLLERVSGVCKGHQGAERATVRDSSGLLADDMGQNKDNEVHRKTSVPIWNLAGVAKYKVGGMPRLVEEEGDQRLEEKEKSKEKGDIKTGDNCKDKEREKHSHRKDKNKEKEKEKKEVKVKGKSEDKKTELDVSKDQHMNDLIGVASYKSTLMLKNCNSNAVNEGNMRKRKDVGSNSYLHESEVRPNKLLKEASHQLTENGRLDTVQTPNLSTSDKQQGIPDNICLGKKDQKVNGIIEAQKYLVSKPETSTATIITNLITEASKKPPDSEKCKSKVLTFPKLEDQIAVASRKPPHTDSKYLSVVPIEPKMDEWSEFDDPDWLFSRKDLLPEKPEVGSDQMNQEQCVWSEAMHVESTNVYAMPYVIPY